MLTTSALLISKEEKYDSDIYFQKNGGWARNDGDNKTEISIYTHSISKINYITTLDELYKKDLLDKVKHKRYREIIVTLEEISLTRDLRTDEESIG